MIIASGILYSLGEYRNTAITQLTGHAVRDGNHTVSKTDYLNWLTCPGYAWTIIHRPELAPPNDAGARRKQLAGDAVEDLARTRFPNARLIEAESPEIAAAHTREAMDAGVTTIFHATCMTERGLLVEADVLERGNNGWHLTEIKSSAADPDRPNGMVKKHLADITFQTLALTEAGIPIARSLLMHVNKHYRRNRSVQPEDALARTDVTSLVAKNTASAQVAVDTAIADLQDGEHPAPCECHRKTRAHRCPMFGHFHPDIPSSDTIYHISGIHKNTLTPAVDRGIVQLVDWPDDLPLSAKQRRQVELARSGEEIVRRANIESWLGRLRFPLHFLDYETFQQPIPMWEGFTPQQQVPFQYSLHIVTDGGVTSHREHICIERGENPVPGLVEKLHLDMHEAGSVVVWNKAFEESRNREMAHLLPDRAPFLHDINQRMVDLADIVSKGWWVHPEFGGRWSLKSVLPAAAPDLCYEDLDISDGGTAAELWTQCMVDDEETVTAGQRAEIINALHAYCSLDTLAMIRIWEHVQDLIAR